MFQEGDLVMAYLQYNWFFGIHAKLEKKKYNPFCMAWKINDSTYTLQLPNNWNISHTFNMANLFAYHPYDEELYEPNFRMISFSNERD